MSYTVEGGDLSPYLDKNWRRNNLPEKQYLIDMFLLAELIDGYLGYYPAGGSLHIVLSDGNYSTEHVDFCRTGAKRKDDFWGVVIAKGLLMFTEDERKQIVEDPIKIFTKISEL